MDVFAFDIQRGRDVGHPTWIQMRKKCGLSANFASFYELREVFSMTTIKLLSQTYESIHDIDLIVGGALESFTSLDKQILGPTFQYIYRDQ
jgi:peroxidase